MRVMKELGASVLLAVAVVAALSGCEHRAAPLPESNPPTELASSEITRLTAVHPAVADWLAEASPEIARWEQVEELPHELALLKTVFWEPRDTASLRPMLNDSARVKGKTVLEIGTGSGLLAFCCLRGGASRVVATDVNPAALVSALYNAQRLGVADRLELRRVAIDTPEAFSVIGPEERFDLIVSNPPWVDTVPTEIGDYAYFDPHFNLLRSLLAGLRDHLKPGGKALLAYGARSAIETVIRLAPEHSLRVEVLDERDLSTLPEVFLPGMLLSVEPQSE